MRKIKILIASLSVFAMLTACGEGFKANLASSEGDVVAVEGETPEEVDQEIQESFTENFLSITASSTEELAKEIRRGAFEINVDVSGTSSRDGYLKNIRASIQGIDCNKIVTITNDKTTLTNLYSKREVNIGQVSNYQVMTRCTTSNCSEMTATLIRKDNSGKIVAALLYGMIGQAKVNKTGGNGYTKKYTANRLVNLSFYGLAPSILDKLLRCNQQNLTGTDFPAETTQTTSSGAPSSIQDTTTQSYLDAAYGFTPVSTTSTNTNAFGGSSTPSYTFPNSGPL